MDTNGAPNPANTRTQPSIRSFFQPRQPSYTPPPGSSVTKPPPTNTSRYTTQTLPSLTPPFSSTTNTAPPSSVAASTPASKKPSTLPPQARISQPLQEHVQPLRRINSLLLPIPYPDWFYRHILAPESPTPSPPNSFSRIILWTDPSTRETKVIGGVICRVDRALSPDSTPPSPTYTTDTHDIYIQSLCLLSPYRGKGLVAAVLDEIIEAAISQQEMKIESLYVHVWTQNDEAEEWYTKRGFKREEPIIPGYYKRLNPDTAYVWRRRLLPSDYVNGYSLFLAPVPSQNVEQSNTPVSQPPTPSTADRPALPSHARSFQDRGPDREWNDLPEDVLGSALLKPASVLASREGSAQSSRSSSRSGAEAKGKKKRVYPAAAFGS